MISQKFIKYLLLFLLLSNYLYSNNHVHIVVNDNKTVVDMDINTKESLKQIYLDGFYRGLYCQTCYTACNRLTIDRSLDDFFKKLGNFHNSFYYVDQKIIDKNKCDCVLYFSNLY